MIKPTPELIVEARDCLEEIIEYVASDKFLARKLIFETVDFNNSLCNRWWFVCLMTN